MSLLDKASLIVTPNAYKTSKLYSVVPSTGAGDMNVVRATTATRVNSAGLIETVGLNIPRIDYTNGSCPSLLVEPQRTNLLTYSNDFSNVIWSKVASSTVTTDSGVQNPSGVSPTFRFNASNLAFGGILRQILTLTVGQTYTFSYFAKKGNYRYVGIRFNNARNGERFPTYDFDTDTLNKQGATCDLSRTLLTNGWVKLTITFTATIITSNCDIALTTSNGDTSTALSGTEFVYVYGAQTELSSYPTSYIPTVASIQTRNADVISKTGITSLIGQTEGTLFSDFSLINTSQNQDFLRINFLDFNNTIIFRKTNLNSLEVFIRIANVTIFVFSFSNLPINSKVCFVYKSGNSSLFVNGFKTNTSTNSFTILTPLNDLILGAFNDTGTNHSNVRINSTQIYKTGLTDTECIALTTL